MTLSWLQEAGAALKNFSASDAAGAAPEMEPAPGRHLNRRPTLLPHSSRRSPLCSSRFLLHFPACAVSRAPNADSLKYACRRLWQPSRTSAPAMQQAQPKRRRLHPRRHQKVRLPQLPRRQRRNPLRRSRRRSSSSSSSRASLSSHQVCE